MTSTATVTGHEPLQNTMDHINTSNEAAVPETAVTVGGQFSVFEPLQNVIASTSTMGVIAQPLNVAAPSRVEPIQTVTTSSSAKTGRQSFATGAPLGFEPLPTVTTSSSTRTGTQSFATGAPLGFEPLPRVKQTRKRGKIPDARHMDVVLPPCRICDGESSGFHYGVNTCEACKGFYRRTLKKSEVDFACKCSGEERARWKQGPYKNGCPACRYERCIAEGMSTNAMKIGRYTLKHRTRNIKEVKSREAADVKQKSLNDIIDNALTEVMLQNSEQSNDSGVWTTEELSSSQTNEQRARQENDGVLTATKLPENVPGSGDRLVQVEPLSCRIQSYHGGDGDVNVKSNDDGTIACFSGEKGQKTHVKSVIIQNVQDGDIINVISKDGTIRGGKVSVTPSPTKATMQNIETNDGHDASDVSKDGRNTTVEPMDIRTATVTVTEAEAEATTANTCPVDKQKSTDNNQPSGAGEANLDVGLTALEPFLLPPLPQHGSASASSIPMSLQEIDSIIQAVTEAQIATRDDLYITPPTEQDALKRQSECLEEYNLKASLFGTQKTLSWKEYKDFYASTGIDIDGRRSHLEQAAEYFASMIRYYVQFCKAIPGFRQLSLQDQSALIKASRVENGIFSCYKHTYENFNTSSQTLISPWGTGFHLEEFNKVMPAQLVIWRHKFAVRIHSLKLTIEEEAVIRALCVVATDRCDLQEPHLVSNIQDKLITCLQHLLRVQYGAHSNRLYKILSLITDLRELTEQETEVCKQLMIDIPEFPDEPERIRQFSLVREFFG